MTVRLWARTPEEAELISPASVPDLSAETAGGLIPFTTEDPILRCLTCDRLLTSAEYVHPSHPCYARTPAASTPFSFTVDDDDITIDLDELSVGLDGWLYAIGALAVIVAADIALAYTVVRLVDWVLR